MTVTNTRRGLVALRLTRGRVVQLFPATTLVLAAYVGLILPIAFIEDNPQMAFILRLLGVAVLGCLVSEGLALATRLQQPTSITPGPGPIDLTKLTWAVVGFAAASRVLYTLSGGGTITAQVAGTHSTLTTLLSPFAAWNLFAVGLLFACYLRGACSRVALLAGLGVMTAVEGWAAFVTTRTAPLQQFATTVLLVALVLRLVRLRTLAIALAVVLVAWPTVFEIRNTARAVSGVTVDTRVGAWDRLRLDQQLGRVADFHVPVDLGQPGIASALRFGIVPRVLDGNRTEIATSSLISAAVGSKARSSYNFLSIGTIYFFYGTAGLFIYYLLAGLLFTFIIGRAVRAGPAAVCMAMLAASYLMGPALTFPDTVIGYLQTLVSFAPILFALLLFPRGGRRVAQSIRRRPPRRRRPTRPPARQLKRIAI